MSSPDPLRVAQERLLVSEGAILPVGVAARLLGGRRFVRWLRDERLIVDVAGVERVVWRDVIARVSAAGRTLDPDPQPSGRVLELDDW